MTKITITNEAGEVFEICATSCAINAISPEKGGIVNYTDFNDTADRIVYLTASLLAGFTDFANRAYENWDHGEMTMEEFVDELAEMADKMLETGEDDA